jgi:hypothetical protein
MGMKHYDSRSLATALLGLLGSGCILPGTFLDDDGTSDQGDDETAEGDEADEAETSDEGDPDQGTTGPDPDPDECLTYGSNLDGSTTPPQWAMWPDFDVTCATGLGHEQLRIEPIAWTSSVDTETLGIGQAVDPLVGATLDGGAIVVIGAEDQLPRLARFSASGALEWTKPFDALGIGFPSDMVGDDDVFYVGTSYPEGARLVAIDEAGEVLWSQEFADVALGGLATIDQGVAVTLLAADLETTTLATYDVDGELLWETQSPVEGGWAVARLPDDDLFVAGAEGWASHFPDGGLNMNEGWDYNWLSIAAVASQGRMLIVGTRGVGESAQVEVVAYEELEEGLLVAFEVAYDRATSWVFAGEPFDPDTATYETSLGAVAVSEGVVLFGTEVALSTDVWTPWVLHASETLVDGSTTLEGLGIDRLFWEGEASHAAAGPGNSLFVVFSNASEPTAIHLRKYQL